MCEVFNRVILSLREKPVITLLEGIKHYITVRIVKQRQMLERYNGEICPKIQVMIEKNKRDVGGGRQLGMVMWKWLILVYQMRLIHIL